MPIRNGWISCTRVEPRPQRVQDRTHPYGTLKVGQDIAGGTSGRIRRIETRRPEPDRSPSVGSSYHFRLQ
jgi:hypothetical protein